MKATKLKRIGSIIKLFGFTLLMFIGSNIQAQVRIQSASGNTGTDTQTSFSVNLSAVPQNGNTLIAVISGMTSTTDNVSSISQTGATWTKAVSESNSRTPNVEIWYTTALLSASSSVTINQSSARSAAVIIEYSGLLYSDPLDQTASDNARSSSASTGTTSTTTEENELYIGAIGLNSSGYSLSSITNSFDLIDNAFTTNATASNNANVYALELIVNSIGTASTGGTVSSWRAYWAGAIATFKEPIISFSPVSACSGEVIINGSGFTGVTAVKFNGVSALYTVDSNSQITATLPADATAGLISVTTSGGAVAYSQEVFLVKKAPVPTADITNTTCPTGTDGAITPNNIPNAINFVSTQNQYIELGSSLLNGLTAFTLEGWIKTNTYSRNSFFGQDNAIEIGFNSSGDIELWSEGLNTNIYAPYPTDGAWHHVAGVGNGSNLSVYVDGVQVETSAHSSLSSPTNYGSSSYTSKIGAYVWNSSTPNYFNGQMLKVGFWNRALTISEIASLASSPKGYTVSDNGLIAGYNFYEGTGTTLSKIPSSGSNGSFVGTSASTWSDIFNYSWTKDASSYSASTKNISGLSTGTYNLEITHELEVAGGTCSSSESFVVASNGSESVGASSITGSSPVCSGTEVEFSLNGGSLGSDAAWKWYSGACGTNEINSGISEDGRTLTVSPTATTTYYARAEGSCNTTDCVSFTVNVNEQGTWLGTTNTDWNTASNWCGGVPTSGTDVIIPSSPVGARFPTVGSAGAVCKSLTINSGATVTMGGAYAFDIYGDLTNNGTFVPATSTFSFKANGAVLGSTTTTFHHLTIDASKTLTASSNTMNITGNWTNNGTFDDNGGTVAFNGTSAQEIDGTNTFNNLTIDNTAGVTGKSDMTVNGILNLASASPNSTNGTLEMVNDYDDYSNIETPADSLSTRTTKSWDILDSNILTMGINASTIGVGDVTGKIKRTSFNENTDYSFGNSNTTITFNKNSTGTLPTSIMFVITKGSNRGIHSNKTNAVERLFQVIRTGGALPTSFTMKLQYREDELNGLTEGDLVLWDHHIPYASALTPHEHGKTAQSLTENWLELSGHGINYIETGEIVGGNTKYWMFASTLTTGNTWLGAVESDETNWDNNSNWSAGTVPTCDDNVIIPNVMYAPTIPSTGANAKSIEIETGATLNGGTGGQLTICGGIATNGGKSSWTNNGTFNAGTSTVTFDHPRTTNAETSTITGSTEFYNLIVGSGTYLVLQANSNTSLSNTLTQTGNLDARTYNNTFTYNGSSSQAVINPNNENGYSNLILSGSGTKTLPSSTLNISGDLTLNASFNSSSNSIVFDGITTQTLSGSSSSELNNVTIDNAAGLDLSKSQIVDGTLTLTDGLINIGTNTLTVTCDGSITGQSSSSYINGKLAREYCTASSKIYPIGKGGEYRPLTLEYTSLSASSTVLAEQFESQIQGSIPSNTTYQSIRYWNLDETAGTGNGNYTIALNGDPFSPDASAKILRGNGTTNTSYAATFSSSVFTSTTITDNVFGNFAVASECLPPTINTQPQATTACELNDTPTFTVVPEAGTYTYTWELNTGDDNWTTISNGGVYSNATTATLTITNPTYDMNIYEYRVNVIRDCGGTTISDEAVLTVNPQPQGSLSGMTNICKGETGYLTWTSTIGTGPFTVVYNAGAGNVSVENVVSGTPFSVAAISSNTTFTLVSVTDQNCSRSSGFTVGSADITVNPYITWTGAVDRDWNTDGNWCGGIPTTDDDVLIPNITNEPLISNTPTAVTKSLIIESQSSVTISGAYTLDISGSITNNGILVGAEGTLLIDGYIENNGTINTKNSVPERESYGGTIVLDGTTTQTLYGATYNDIVIDNAAGVVMPEGATVNTLGTFEIKSGAKMEIGTGRAVIADNVINSAGQSGILIKAAQNAVNGSLVFNNSVENPIQATVQMYSPANITVASSSTYFWQYFGVPFKSLGQIGDVFYGAYVRRYNEPGYGTKSTTALEDRLWVQLQNNDIIKAKSGYELTQSTPKTYTFAGELYNSNIDTVLNYTPKIVDVQGQYPGQHVLSNPYTTAIRISDIIFGNNMDSTVYIYNTGSYAQWGENNTTFGGSAGQYIAAPLNTAGTGGVPAEIPSMQGFLVRTNRADTGSLYINYKNVKTPNTTPQRAHRAPLTWLRLNMVGKNTSSGDVLWLFSNPQTTRGSDNGWDAMKIASASGTPMLYSWTESAAYQINALPDIHETNIVFRAGSEETEFTMTCDNEMLGVDYENVYLFDKETGDITNITETGTVYEFTSSSESASLRFQILTSLPEVTDIQKTNESKIKVFSSSHYLFVDNKSDEDCLVEIFDQPGRLLAKYKSNAGELKSIDTGFNPGSYIVRTTGTVTQSQVVIIQ